MAEQWEERVCYGIVSEGGRMYMSEMCIAEDAGALADELEVAQEDSPDEGYRIMPLYVYRGDDIPTLQERNERLQARIAELRVMLTGLLGHLPDSEHSGDESWDWCWNELSGRAQDSVKDMRAMARALLGAHDV